MRQQQMQMEAQRQREAQRDSMLAQLLTSEARERCMFLSVSKQTLSFFFTFLCLFSSLAVSRVALVKPEKARAVGDMIIQSAMTGRIGGRVDEDELIRILEQVSAQFDKQVTVKFVRRRDFDDDDDDDDDFQASRKRDDDDDDDDDDDE